MYKRHKIAVVIVWTISTLIAYVFDLDYADIASIAISVIAMALAVYIAATSAILGSPYAKKLRQTSDQEIPTKTALGVFSEYLHMAGFYGILTITISCFYIFEIFNKLLDRYPVLYKLHFYELMCAFSCGILAINILFLWLIFEFLIISLPKSVD